MGACRTTTRVTGLADGGEFSQPAVNIAVRNNRKRMRTDYRKRCLSSLISGHRPEKKTAPALWIWKRRGLRWLGVVSGPPAEDDRIKPTVIGTVWSNGGWGK